MNSKPAILSKIDILRTVQRLENNQDKDFTTDTNVTEGPKKTKIMTSTLVVSDARRVVGFYAFVNVSEIEDVL